MKEETLTQEVAIDKLPFNIERKNNHIEIYSKSLKHLPREKKKEFENKKVTVELFLFSKDDIEHLHKLQPNNFDIMNTFYDILNKIREKLTSTPLKR